MINNCQPCPDVYLKESAMVILSSTAVAGSTSPTRKSSQIKKMFRGSRSTHNTRVSAIMLLDWVSMVLKMEGMIETAKKLRGKKIMMNKSAILKDFHQ